MVDPFAGEGGDDALTVAAIEPSSLWAGMTTESFTGAVLTKPCFPTS